MKIFNRKTWLVFPVALLAFTACTKLEENLNSELFWKHRLVAVPLIQALY